MNWDARMLDHETATGSSPSLPPGMVLDAGVQPIEAPMEFSDQE